MKKLLFIFIISISFWDTNLFCTSNNGSRTAIIA